MKINWKLRLKNKATLLALIGVVIAFVYQVLAIFGIMPPVAKNTIIELAALVVNLLVALGVVVDPSTAGIADSDTAMEYVEPRMDTDTELIEEVE